MELWRLKETAERTGMSVAFWRKQVLKQRIPVFKLGRSVRLDSGAVRAFLAARIRPAKREGPQPAEPPPSCDAE
jgi:predicted DNA-binding transcriptional regulator AlpA